ncbi:PilZ domain-containing protein [Methylobacterium oxalidis]|uniref:PilZ domain-containing protein n=1 Tax=Methylobacterium oxalidis TaxID=944322 RepID=A0A512IZS9_9HYPH|nr:PilZ domain-containing protein [Methylobacterium oxalidis]GEP03207.1 hypothetical protein MOX02_12450 [Methylobacterium oxalidis]GJE30852.1 hypothetical protein LDDCCGHA_1022 [Methylobacterium oxalidis]GLS67467.1 hypothetical protein GCM10007888_58510 [Methylobacterium oxalidis]
MPGPDESGRDAERPRAAKRRRVIQQGRIVAGPERLVACTIHDLSRAGAKIRLSPRIALPESFDLVIVGDELSTHRARLRWRRGDFAGLTFEAS